jgi:hypothetical protein
MRLGYDGISSTLLNLNYDHFNVHTVTMSVFSGYYQSMNLGVFSCFIIAIQ